MKDDDGVLGMTIHKWLGIALAVFLVGLVLWRWPFFKSDARPSIFYLLFALAATGAVVFQGHLGGDQSFGSLSDARQEKLLTDVEGPLLRLKSTSAIMGRDNH